MNKRILTIAALASIFTACTQHAKKVVIAYKGKTEINEIAKTINVRDGAGGGDKELTFSGSDKVIYTLENGAEKKSLEMPDDGYYFINARPDTLIGSFQNFGALQKESKMVTQDMVLNSIDSLKNLVANKNISEANKNFFILPYTITKLTPNAKAVIIAPFHQISTLEQVDGKAPEVYQFWTINEIRTKIEKQTALVEGKKTTPNK